MLTYILIGLVVLIAIILIAASMKPNTVHYERSTTINAGPEKILPYIADFHKWTAWSPYEKLDANMKRTYGGATEGKGARYAWESTGKAGIGSMEILETSSTAVRIDLRFIKPFKADCIALFTCVPQSASTKVTWSMNGPDRFMSKVMGTLMNMDKMIGKDFETGLAGLKTISER